MRVFVTGASGHIASAVIPELLQNGHTVTGLARSDESAATVAALGAEVVRGDLQNLDVLKTAAAASDGVIHLGFRHEAMRSGDFEGAIATDFEAIRAMADALDRSDKPFVGTSGSLMLTTAGIEGRAGTEDDVAPSGPRADAENFVIGLADRGIRSSAVRLAPTVHSELDHHGFIPALIGFARQNGFAAYVGEGANRWPAADTYDIGTLYRLALEQAPAGSRLHGTAEEGVAVKTTAEAIAAGLGIETRSITAEEAPQYLQYLAMFNQLDNPTSSAKTRALLGWTPKRPGLIEDIAAGHYFA